MFNPLAPQTRKKVTFHFDHLGRLCLRLVETMQDGKKLFYYLQDDGAWHQYNPAVDSVEPLSNQRFPELASNDPADVSNP